MQEADRLCQQIIEELEADNADLERVGGLQAELGHLVGSEQAARMVLDAYTST